MATTLRVVGPQADDPVSEVRSAYDRLRQAYLGEPYPSVEVREDRLKRVIRLLKRHAGDFAEAIDADFSGRSRHETLLADIYTTLESARHTLRHVSGWMKPQRVSLQWFMRPASARIEWQPLGVVAVVGAWNYPVNLVLAPMIPALAAGNRVLLKPSELTPKTAALLAQLVREHFAADEIAVALGGPEVARTVVSLPFDHILFTGSTRIGREVARAAAENLTPVTLELGGKSPALVHPDYSVEAAADRVMAGKLLNAGQTCIAPDYVMVARGREEAFAQACRALVAQRYPDLARNRDYSAMATPSGFDRMKALLADAQSKGARVETVCPGLAPEEGSRKVAPVLVFGATDQMRLMQEEIFGPILPIIPYGQLDEAIAFINRRPRPLAFYYFDENGSRAQSVLRRTISGGACVNDTLLHFAQDELPFGGIGESGMGRYHGYDGFTTFSHKKAVFSAGFVNPSRKLLGAPYSKLLDRTMRFLIAD